MLSDLIPNKSQIDIKETPITSVLKKPNDSYFG